MKFYKISNRVLKQILITQYKLFGYNSINITRSNTEHLLGSEKLY